MSHRLSLSFLHLTSYILHIGYTVAPRTSAVMCALAWLGVCVGTGNGTPAVGAKGTALASSPLRLQLVTAIEPAHQLR